jgi:hypothetical protein
MLKKFYLASYLLLPAAAIGVIGYANNGSSSIARNETSSIEAASSILSSLESLGSTAYEKALDCVKQKGLEIPPGMEKVHSSTELIGGISFASAQDIEKFRSEGFGLWRSRTNSDNPVEAGIAQDDQAVGSSVFNSAMTGEESGPIYTAVNGFTVSTTGCIAQGRIETFGSISNFADSQILLDAISARMQGSILSSEQFKNVQNKWSSCIAKEGIKLESFFEISTYVSERLYYRGADLSNAKSSEIEIGVTHADCLDESGYLEAAKNVPKEALAKVLPEFEPELQRIALLLGVKTESNSPIAKALVRPEITASGVSADDPRFRLQDLLTGSSEFADQMQSAQDALMERCYADNGLNVDYGPLPDNHGALIDAVAARDVRSVALIRRYGYGEMPRRGARASSASLDSAAARNSSFGEISDQCASLMLKKLHGSGQQFSELSILLNQGQIEIDTKVHEFEIQNGSSWKTCLGTTLYETPEILQSEMAEKSTLKVQVDVALKDRECQIETGFRAEIDEIRLDETRKWMQENISIVEAADNARIEALNRAKVVLASQ